MTQSDRRDPAASMALMRQLVRDDAGQEYAEAALRHRARPLGRASHWVFVAVLVLVAAILAVAAMQRRAAAPEAERAREALVDRATQAQAEVETLQRGIDRTRADLAAAQEVLLTRTDEGARLAARLDALALATGFAPVSGPGLVVTLDDAPGATTAADDPGRVLDRDVQQALNGLWQAGAEAVAVNGQRVTATTAVRSAGSAILVDYRPVLPPYRIEAIGDPATLAQGFATSSSARSLATVVEEYGIALATDTADSLTLPASTALLPVRARVTTTAAASVAATP